MTTPYASRRASPAPRLYQCGTCFQSFSRIDHLSRHVRSHTHEKPYKCPVCGKRFGRIDLLSRHSSLHQDGDGHTSNKRRRNDSSTILLPRTSQACTTCAENHLRCDEEKPCKRCQRRKIECTVPLRQEAVFNASATASESSRIEHGDQSPVNSLASRGEPTHIKHNIFATPPVDTAAELWPKAQSDQDPPNPPIDLSVPLAKDYPHLITPAADVFPAGFSLDNPSGIRTPRGLITFGLETDLDLSMVDFDFLELYNSRIPFQFDEQETPPSRSGSAPGDGVANAPNNVANDRSMQRLRWRFVPEPKDHGYAEHDNLLLPPQADYVPNPGTFAGVDGQGSTESLDLASRDRILSIFLSQMNHPISQDKLCFPSVELLDILIRYFLTAPTSNANIWIHFTTFHPKQTRPELLLAMATIGALLTPDPSLRKLGFAMQEVVRHQIPVVLEADNTNIHNLELLQAYMLCLKIGLWSGNNRKMEICESSRLPLVTILRRRGLFHHSAYPSVRIGAGDVGETLETRWRSWVRQESFKRLVYNLLQHDAQLSMVLLTNPLLSYAEMSLLIPCCRELWTARTAQQWKEIYSERFANWSIRMPTLLGCIANLDLLECHKQIADTSLACSSILYAMWGMVWEYRQFSVLLASQSRYWDNGILMTSRYQELIKMLRYFRMGYGQESGLLFNLILMHMHMSLEEVQILATMEDPKKTSEIPPSIHAWSKSKECREALWHAGQVIRELKALPPLRLRDFMALALYHASLALWAHAMVSSRAVATHTATQMGPMVVNAERVVWLDSEDTDDVHRYIALERGRPALVGIPPELASVSLADPGAVLDFVLRLMHWNHRNEREPPLVDNLVHLIEKLRDVSM